MAKISGNLIFLEWDGSDVVGLTDKSIDFSTDMIDTTNQQSTGAWKTYLPGEKGSTINFSGVYDEAGSEGASTLFADLTNGTEVTFKIGEKASSSYWTGKGLVSSISCSGPKNDAASYTGTIQVTGPVTVGTASF
jgi:TP901-1 family phage major tail protein